MRVWLAALLALAACSNSGNSVPQNNVCVSRCETKSVVCGIDDRMALARCGRLCAAMPTDAQLICVEGLSCADLLLAAMPCGLTLDAGAPDASAD